MTKTTNPLRLALEDVLDPAGFTRQGGTWFRKTNDVVQVVNLQKSQDGKQYFINYAIWLRALGEESFPKEEKCHIRMRAGAVVSSESNLASLLDHDVAEPNDERRARLAQMLASEFLPYVDAGQTNDGLRSLLADGSLKKAMVHVAAKELLGR